MGHLLIVHSGARPTTVTIALDLTVSQLACILEYIYISLCISMHLLLIIYLFIMLIIVIHVFDKLLEIYIDL